MSEAAAFYVERITAEIERDRVQSEKNGWRWFPRGMAGHTIGDFTGAVLAIDNPDDARRFYDSYVAFMTAIPAAERSAEFTPQQVAQANIGWCFGEGMRRDRIAMWIEVSGASHPVFGSMNPPPTPQQAYDAGLAAGMAGRE